MTVIKWAWRHHALGATFFDSPDEAVEDARWASDYGEEALDCIEVIDSEGTSRILTAEEIEAFNRPREEAELADLEARPKAVAHIRLVSPDGTESALYEGFATEAAAHQEAERLSEILGPDRVKVEPVRIPYAI